MSRTGKEVAPFRGGHHRAAGAGVESGTTGRTMRTLLYDSDNFFVIESPAWGGIEVIDKQYRRSAFLGGGLAVSVRATMADLASHPGGARATDEFLRQYAWLYTNPMTLH